MGFGVFTDVVDLRENLIISPGPIYFMVVEKIMITDLTPGLAFES